jgi:hypothetical protein
MTAYAMKGDRERCLAQGMDDYIAKPISLSTLTSVLSRWIPVSPAAPLAGIEPGGYFGTGDGQSDDAVLDPGVLASLRQLGISVPEALASTLVDVASSVDTIVDSLEQENYDLIRDTAHRINGAATTIGARQLQAAASRLEANAWQPVHGEIAILVTELCESWERVREVI